MKLSYLDNQGKEQKRDADKEQKKVLDVLVGNFETYARYYWVADKAKKS